MMLLLTAQLTSAHTWTHKLGFLPAGSDVPSLPIGNASTLSDAKATCERESTCRGFTFKGTDASPNGTIGKVYFKVSAEYKTDLDWQTYLKDYVAVPLLYNPCANVSSIYSKQPWCNPRLSTPARVADMIGRMRLDEKIAQMATDGPPIHSLGLHGYNWWSEASHGVATDRDTPTTNFAFPITTAMSFNRTLWRATGGAIGTEARAIMNAGNAYSTFWAPVVNLAREPRWGRNVEVPGEDPFLSGQYAIEFVKGMQQSADDPSHILASACCKHYVANSMEHSTVDGQTHTRHDFDEQISAQDLLDSYMPPFQMCVEQGQVSGLMCSYNAVNGKPSCANDWLLSTVARGEWGFEGYVTSDCGADANVFFNHHYTKTPEESVAAVLHAGTDVDCGDFVTKYALSALSNGTINEADLDKRLTNLFSVRMRLGHFDPPGPLQQIPLSVVCTEATQNLAADGVAQSAVLLKNLAVTLPLSPGQTVAVIGPTAKLSRADASYYGPGNVCGGNFWTLVDGIAAHSGKPPVYAAGVPSVLSNNTSAIAAAASLASSVDRVVIAIGTDLTWAMEEKDADPVHGISLTPAQSMLVDRVAAAAKSPVVVVIMTANPLDISEILSHPKIGAVVHLGQPSVAVRGAGDVLYGVQSPAGRMVQTVYPKEYATSVSIFDFNMRPGPSSFPAPGCTKPWISCPNGTNPGRTYRFYTGKPVVPFGFGLSYTTFRYKLLQSPSAPVSLEPVRTLIQEASEEGRSFFRHVDVRGDADGPIGEAAQPTGVSTAPLVNFEVEVTNTGAVDADDVVLGFLTPPGAGTAGLPRSQLFGFERVHVKAGQSVRVWLYPQLNDFTQVDRNGTRFVPNGQYSVTFGIKDTAAHGMGFAEHFFDTF